MVVVRSKSQSPQVMQLFLDFAAQFHHRLGAET